jgi:hypothetical protein
MQKNTINMKTIEIQNCTEYRDNMFKVFINSEKHVVRFQSKIQVADDKPFEVRAKYFWDGSPKYTLEPKDNMVLQILVNSRMMNRDRALLAVAVVLVFVIMWFFGNEYYVIPYIPWLFLGIYQNNHQKEKVFYHSGSL